jgi:hypothetical protein
MSVDMLQRIIYGTDLDKWTVDLEGVGLTQAV